MKKILELLLTPMSPKDKKALIQVTMKNSEVLEAILTLALKYNKSATSVLKASRQVKGTEREGKFLAEDLRVLVHVILGKHLDEVISNNTTFKIASCVTSPVVSGLTPKMLSSILQSSIMTPIEAAGILGYTFEDTEVIVNTCAACNRTMVSVDATGLCATCSGLLVTYTNYRRGPFEVPINTFNIPKLIGDVNTLPIDVTYLDYKITKGVKVIKFTPVKPKDNIKFILPLPIVEFQKEIVTLSKV